MASTFAWSTALCFIVITTFYMTDGLVCVSCRGGIGSPCLLKPWEELHKVHNCTKCANFARITKADKKLYDVQRDCYNRIFPAPIPYKFENKCKDDNSHFIECTHTCSNGDSCHNNISYAPTGWREDGSVIVTGNGGNSAISITSSFSLLLLALLAFANIC